MPLNSTYYIEGSQWLPSRFACYKQSFAAFKLCLLYTAAFGCLQALLVIQQLQAAFKLYFLQQQPLAAFKLYLSYSSLWLPSSFACYKATLDAFKLCLLYRLPSSYDCYTAAFGCLQALIATQSPLATFKLCLLNNSLRLPIQQPLAAFKLCLLYSSLCLPSSFACYKQPLAAFKLCLLYSSLSLPSSFDCYTAAFGCLQVLLDTAAVGCLQVLLHTAAVGYLQDLLACIASYTALLNIQQSLAAF